MLLVALVLASSSIVGASQVAVFDSTSKFPGYTGPEVITGNVTLTEEAGSVTSFAVSLSGFAPFTQGGLSLHTGVSCAAANIGGLFYAPFNGQDPYQSMQYSADAAGVVSARFDISTGYPFTLLRGRALELYIGDKISISCALTQPVSPVQVPLERFVAYTGKQNVSGFVSLVEQQQDKGLVLTYVLKGLSAGESGSVYAIEASTCANHSVKYYWQPATAENPWLDPSATFRANQQGEAEGAFQINQALDPLRTHGLVVALADGSEVAACGLVPAQNITPEKADTGDWALGVLCSTLASFGTVAGMLLQKWSHMLESKKPKKTHVMCRPLWWLSLFFMILVPAPLDIAAFAFASQSLLAPLSAVTLLLNAVFAPLVLKETVTRRDLLASVLIAIGAGITTVFGAHTQTQYTIPTLYILFARPSWIMCQVLANLGILVLWWTVRVALAEHSHFINLRIMFKNWLAYLLSLLVALCGAQQMVFTKTVSELIKASAEGDMQFTYFLTYVLIGLAIWMAVFQIGYLNKGLELFDAVYFLPLYNAALIVLCIVVGGVYFAEVDHVDWVQILLFVIGVIICLGGVLLLKKRPAAIDGNAKQEALISDEELSIPSQAYTDSDL